MRPLPLWRPQHWGFGAVHVASFLVWSTPALRLALDAWRGTLGVDPLHRLLHDTGYWALAMLLVTLSVTPLRRLSVLVAQRLAVHFGRRISDWNVLIRLRRQMGLFAFFYASLHLGLYVVLDVGLEAQALWHDLLERASVGVGLLTYALLVPLALTSSQAAMRCLKQRWPKLHLLVYPAALGAVLHDWLQTKLGHPAPILASTVLAALLMARLWAARRGDHGPSDEVTVRERLRTPL
jgi:methionine sulfoxide reductase heme-binding subunit